jgi:hypothetical protein
MEELLKHIAKISNEFSFKIANLDNVAANNQIALELVIANSNKIDNGNIFFVPPIQKDKVESYTSLLICYLLIHHHGGKMEVRNEGDKIEYLIYLPKKPSSAVDDKKISAEDLDFSNEANERLSCDHDGEDIEIGFNAKFLVEMLNNLSCKEVSLKFSAPNRAGLILPATQDANEDILMLVMPVMLNNYV